MFGIPFFIKVTNGETLESVSERIRKKLDVTAKDFEKVWRKCFQKIEVYGLVLRSRLNSQLFGNEICFVAV